jgi:hypothetical protein
MSLFANTALGYLRVEHTQPRTLKNIAAMTATFPLLLIAKDPITIVCTFGGFCTGQYLGSLLASDDARARYEEQADFDKHQVRLYEQQLENIKKQEEIQHMRFKIRAQEEQFRVPLLRDSPPTSSASQGAN